MAAKPDRAFLRVCRRCPAQTRLRNHAGSGLRTISQQKRRHFLFLAEEKPDALVLLFNSQPHIVVWLLLMLTE